MKGNSADEAITQMAYKYFEPHDGADADVLKVTRCDECRYERECSKHMVLTRRVDGYLKVITTQLSYCSYGAKRE